MPALIVFLVAYCGPGLCQARIRWTAPEPDGTGLKERGIFAPCVYRYTDAFKLAAELTAKGNGKTYTAESCSIGDDGRYR